MKPAIVIPEGCGEGSQGCVVFRATPGGQNTRHSRPGRGAWNRGQGENLKRPVELRGGSTHLCRGANDQIRSGSRGAQSTATPGYLHGVPPGRPRGELLPPPNLEMRQLSFRWDQDVRLYVQGAEQATAPKAVSINRTPYPSPKILLPSHSFPVAGTFSKPAFRPPEM